MRVGGRSQREGRRAMVRAQLRWRGGPRAGGTLSHQEPAVGLQGWRCRTGAELGESSAGQGLGPLKWAMMNS